MRFVVFDDYRVGVLAPDGVRDVTTVVPGWDPAPPQTFMNRLIANYDNLKPVLEAAAGKATPRPLESVRLRPPLPAPMNVYAAPANYHAHIEEMRQNDDAPRNSTRELGFFLKAPASISGASDPILLPDRPGRRFDHESELTFIIGKLCRGVSLIGISPNSWYWWIVPRDIWMSCVRSATWLRQYSSALVSIHASSSDDSLADSRAFGGGGIGLASS